MILTRFLTRFIQNLFWFGKRVPWLHVPCVAVFVIFTKLSDLYNIRQEAQVMLIEPHGDIGVISHTTRGMFHTLINTGLSWIVVLSHTTRGMFHTLINTGLLPNFRRGLSWARHIINDFFFHFHQYLSVFYVCQWHRFIVLFEGIRLAVFCFIYSYIFQAVYLITEYNASC